MALSINALIIPSTLSARTRPSPMLSIIVKAMTIKLASGGFSVTYRQPQNRPKFVRSARASIKKPCSSEIGVTIDRISSLN